MAVKELLPVYIAKVVIKIEVIQFMERTDIVFASTKLGEL